MSDNLRSYQDVNPTAGNLGSKDSFSRGVAREVNRTRPQDIRSGASRRGGGDWTGLGASMTNFKPSPDIKVVEVGSGWLNVGALVDGIRNREPMYM